MKPIASGSSPTTFGRVEGGTRHSPASSPPAGPAATPPQDGGPPAQSPLPFLLYGFVIPLLIVLTLQYFGVFERVSKWLGLD